MSEGTILQTDLYSTRTMNRCNKYSKTNNYYQDRKNLYRKCYYTILVYYTCEYQC